MYVKVNIYIKRLYLLYYLYNKRGVLEMEVLQQIPWGLVLPILIIQLILLFVAIIDLIKIPQTNGPKWLWGLIIVFVNLIGPILYFVIGRKQS